MAIYNQALLTQASNLTYYDNNNNEISAADVRALNNDWISSSILVPMTASMTVLSSSYAVTASYVSGSSTSAISASYALSSSNAISASYALTASFVQNAQTASYVLQAVSSSFAISASNAQTASFVTSSNVFGPFGSNSILTSSFATTSSFVTGSNVFGPFGSNSIISASFARAATSSSFATTASFALNVVGGSGFPFTGSAIISGSLIVTGSVSGRVLSASISSNTCSINLGLSNYFVVTLPDATTTFFNVTNPQPGQTSQIVVTTGINSSASFSSNVKQPSGSFYRPTTDPNTDVLSLVAVNTSNILMVNSKMFI